MHVSGDDDLAIKTSSYRYYAYISTDEQKAQNTFSDNHTIRFFITHSDRWKTAWCNWFSDKISKISDLIRSPKIIQSFIGRKDKIRFRMKRAPDVPTTVVLCDTCVLDTEQPSKWWTVCFANFRKWRLPTTSSR